MDDLAGEVAGMNATMAYQICERITRDEARNFSYGIRLLPREKRQALSAVYAMARRIDDIGDGSLPASEKASRLESIRAELHALTNEPGGLESAGPGGDPVLMALADAARRLPIPLGAFDELIDGCQADVEGRQYLTAEQLIHYCRCVAGSVGRLALGVYSPRAHDTAQPLADALGVALQLTNILRDVREDRLLGRVYLPQADLERFGCRLELGPGDLIDDPPDRFAALVRFEAERAEQWYERGLGLLPLLDRRSAACTAAMAGIYHRLLDRIATDPVAVQSSRLSLSTRQKSAVAVQALTRRTA